MTRLSARLSSWGLAAVLTLNCLVGPAFSDPTRPAQLVELHGKAIKASGQQTVADPNNLAPPRQRPPASALIKTEQAPTLSFDLARAIEEVLAKSPTVEQVASRIRQAEYQVDEAYTLANPTVGFTAQYSHVVPPVSVPNIGVVSPADNYQFALVIRQAIYTFGRLKWTALAAKLQERASQEDYRSEVDRLVQLTAQRYIEALLSQDAVGIANDNLEAQRANLHTSELLYKQGVAAHFDVLSNAAAVARAEQKLIEARTAETNAKARMLSLLDYPLNSALSLEAIDLYAPGAIDLVDAKSRALESRPDLRSARWILEQAKAKVEVARTSNNPTLEIQNTSINRNAAGFNVGTQNTTALVLSIPLYDGGVAHARTEQAKEAVTQLSRGLEQSERDVTLQVEEAFHQLQDSWIAIGVAQESVRQADEALRVAVLRYENGISTNTELLDTQATRSQARFDLATARAHYLQARWNWWKVTASAYPTEVPYPPVIRERLKEEGVPMKPLAPEFSEIPSGQTIGPLLPTLSSPPAQPIRGLPSSPEDLLAPALSPAVDSGSQSESRDKLAPNL